MNMTKHNYARASLALALGLLLNAVAVAAAPPRLEPLVQEGKWPGFTRGDAFDVPFHIGQGGPVRHPGQE